MSRYFISFLGFLAVLSLVFHPTFFVQAARTETIKTPPTEEDVDAWQDKENSVKNTITEKADEAGITFNQVKDKLTTAINTAIAKLEKTEDAIQNNPYLTQTTKEELTDALNRMQASLQNYLYQLENYVTNMEELEELNQTVVAYIYQNKNLIKDATKQSVLAILGEVEKTVDEIIEEAESALASMSTSCTGQAETIEQANAQIDELQKLNEQLKSELKAKDAQGAKAVLEQIKPILFQLSKDMKTIFVVCYL